MSELSEAMGPDSGTIRVKGREIEVGQLRLDDHEVVIHGRVLKISCVKDEWYHEVRDPAALIGSLASLGVADLFTFIQRPPDCVPRYNYHVESDNVAAICLQSYDHWWDKQIGSNARGHIRKAKKSGISVRTVDFDDNLVKGIQEIYNETPLRQGKPFWHYMKDFDYLRKVHETYLDRCDFVGAYVEDELVGFIKLVYAGETANLMHIISKNAHRDKAVTNALIDKAVEICCQKGIRYLDYDKYDYGIGGSASLLLFKQTNGFVKVEFPRYYVPLTYKGRLALKLNLQHGLIHLVPRKLLSGVVDLRNNIRTRWYEHKYRVR